VKLSELIDQRRMVKGSCVEANEGAMPKGPLESHPGFRENSIPQFPDETQFRSQATDPKNSIPKVGLIGPRIWDGFEAFPELGG